MTAELGGVFDMIALTTSGTTLGSIEVQATTIWEANRSRLGRTTRAQWSQVWSATGVRPEEPAPH